MNPVRYFEPKPFEMNMSSNKRNCTMAELPQSSLPLLEGRSFSSSLTLRLYGQPSAYKAIHCMGVPHISISPGFVPVLAAALNDLKSHHNQW
jgi:hypothetical protein